MANDEEKALERLHTDASFVPGPRADGKTWLNSAEVVDRIVRDFVNNMLAQFENKPNFMPWLEFECRRLNNLFLGVTPSDTYAIGPWNTPDQCGDYVLRALTINGESRLAVRDAFMVLTSRVLDLAASSKEFDPAALDAEIDRLRHALLGTSETL